MERFLKFIRSLFKQPRSPDGRFYDPTRGEVITKARQMRADYERGHPEHKWRKTL